MSGTVEAVFDSVDQLPNRTERPLRDLILGLADSKRILGIRYAEWVLGAPELEASIASSSLAQDEWGHSRALYALLKDFGDDPNHIEHEREASDYRNIEALDETLATWSDFVIANAIVDTAITVQLQALADSAYGPLKQRVNKQLDEERFHFGHGRAWFLKLARASDEARSSLKASLTGHWPGVVAWFGPDDFAEDLAEHGLASATGGELKRRFLDRVGPIIEEAGLSVPADEVDFSNWKPETRRTNSNGPDNDAVSRARGDKNRTFLMD